MKSWIPAICLFTLLGAVIAFALYEINKDRQAHTVQVISPQESDPTNCRTATLSETCAEKALKAWLGSNGSIKVTGVQDAAPNTAIAVITLRDYRYDVSLIGKTVYSGPATAGFQHFNDGRWMLSRVDFQARGIGPVWITSIDIEVR